MKLDILSVMMKDIAGGHGNVEWKIVSFLDNLKEIKKNVNQCLII